MGKKRYLAILAGLLTVAVLMTNIPLLVLPVSAAAEQAQTAVTVEYYGRGALEGLDNATALLYAYDQLVAGVENATEQISVYDSENTLNEGELQVVWDAYTRDHTEHFWVAGGYRYSHYSTGEIVTVLPNYSMSGETLTAAQTAFSQAADAILDGVTDNMSEYEKELYLHDKLAEHVTYVDGTNAHNAYGALVEGKAVCDGYAEAFQYLLRQAGVLSFIMIGSSVLPGTNSAVGHAWNLVRVDDAYYHTDVTWDDQGEELYHAYLNLTDAVIREDHAITATEYALPVCDSAEAQYFTGSDARLESYTAKTVGKLLIENDLQVHVYIPGSVDDFISWYGTNKGSIVSAAGISEACSCGYSRLGRELVLRINGMIASVTVGGETAAYSTLTKALENCTDGAALRLLADTEESLSISKQINIDLNGFDIGGNVSASSTVIVWDSETDDYTVLNGDGYGRITGTATGVTPVEGYVMVAENDGTSFHKVDVSLKSVSLRASAAGLYYTGKYDYDEVVARNLTACGVTLSTSNAVPVADEKDAASRYTTSPYSTLLKDIMAEGNNKAVNRANAKMLVYSRAYLKLTDGTCVYSQINTTNLQTVVESIDGKVWTSLKEKQKESLADMYQTYSTVMDAWDIDNLKAYCSQR